MQSPGGGHSGSPTDLQTRRTIQRDDGLYQRSTSTSSPLSCDIVLRPTSRARQPGRSSGRSRGSSFAYGTAAGGSAIAAGGCAGTSLLFGRSGEASGARSHCSSERMSRARSRVRGTSGEARPSELEEEGAATVASSSAGNAGDGGGDGGGASAIFSAGAKRRLGDTGDAGAEERPIVTTCILQSTRLSFPRR